jgi:hypothetical protein
MSKSTYLLKFPTSVRTAAARLAKAEGVSLNQFIADAVAEKVGYERPPASSWSGAPAREAKGLAQVLAQRGTRGRSNPTVDRVSRTPGSYPRVVNLDGTYATRASSVHVRQDGAWKLAFHQQTPATR